MGISILRLPAVLKKSGNSRSQHYSLIDQGLWPKGFNISERSVGWTNEEVDALNAARIAGKSEDEIRALVVELIELRKKMA